MISSFEAFLFVFFSLIPLMAIFAIPLAAGLAIHTTLGNLLVHDELLIISFFSAAQRALWVTVLFFTFIICSVYVPLTFYWAPQSYWAGKRALIRLAKHQFHQFEAGKFHTPFPGATFYFKQKSEVSSVVHYDMIFLAFNGKHAERYFFTAQQGAMKNNCLYLLRGSVYSISLEKHHFATFEQTVIDLSKIFNLEKEFLQGHQAKFLPMRELWYTRDNQESSYEFHKRCAQVLWLFLFPFLALMSVLVSGGRKSNWLLGVSFNGLVFLVSYISTSLAHVVWGRAFLAYILMYGVMGLTLGIVVWRFLKKARN